MKCSPQRIVHRSSSLVPFVLLALSPGSAAAAQGDFLATVDQALGFAAQQLEAAVQSISTTRYPSTTGSSGSWATTGPGDWTSGFFPGCLWLLHDWSGESVWRTRAEAWLVELEDEKNDTSTHDVGFKIFPSFGNGQRLTGSEAYRQVLLTAAGSLATRYSPTVGAIRSWNGPTSSDFRVIIDNMMNLELLFWSASHGGESAWRDMAVSHALKTRENHVRSDGSTYQVVNYDPATGAVKWKDTHQGYAAESTWARGQGWAVYGFTMCYRETGDLRFLETARLCADYFVTHLPSDGVPYWDFELPGTAGEPRDSSAAAIAASGLLELARLEAGPLRAQAYLDAARGILAVLASPAYLAQGTANDAILLHGTQNRPDDRFDSGLIYGDYYFVEALVRYLHWYGLEPAVSAVSVATDGGVPADVVLAATDAQECELLFSIVDPPAHGSLGPLVDRPCQAGTFQRDTATVTYTPAPGFEGEDSFTYRASDGVHESGLGLVSVTVGGGSQPGTTFTSVADSKTRSTSATTNYGTETTLRLRSTGPEWRSYVKFTLSGLSGPVSAATLRLWVTTGSNDGGRVFATGNGWTETGLTWNNAPGLAGSALDAAGAVPSGTWAEYDVTPAVAGNGTFSFALTSQSTTSCYFSSREGAHPPELVVTAGGGGDTTPPALIARTPAAGASGVALGTDVTATFDEPVAGVSGTSFVLKLGTTPVAASVGYDAPTRTAQLDPSADLLPGETYTAELTGAIVDLASPSNALVPLQWTFTTAIGPQPGTTFTSVADSKAKSTSATTNYGTETTLRLRSTGPEWRSYVKFTLSGLSGPVSAATLRLWVTTGSNDGGRVFATGNGWTETGLTWNNAPGLAGSALDAAGAVPSGTWAEYDVTPAVAGNGTFSFALTSQSTTSCYFSSREGAHPPELVVTAGGGGDTTPPALIARTPAAGASGVALGTDVTATFDEPVAGVSGTSFVLKLGTTPVAASVGYDAPTRTARLDPSADLLPGETYTAELTGAIVDLASPSNALVPLQWTFTTAIGPQPGTTFTSVADSKTRSTSATTNYGTETTLRLRSTGPEWRSYVKFTLSGLSGPVSAATLRLWVTTGSNDGGRVFATGNGWTETGLTWNNAPGLAGSALDAAGAVPSGTWAEYDVTPAVAGNGTFSFALTSQSTTSCYFSSREGAHPPELVVTAGQAPLAFLAPARGDRATVDATADPRAHHAGLVREREPNRDLATASRFAPGIAGAGSIAFPGDADSWRIELVRGTAVAFRLRCLPGSGAGAGLVMELRSPEGGVLRVQSPLPGDARDLEIPCFLPAASGPHRVAVRGLDPASAGERYLLEAEVLALGTIQEERESRLEPRATDRNDFPGTAEGLEPGVLRGFLVEGESDVFLLPVPAGACVLRLEACAFRNGLQDGSAERFDPQLVVRGEDGAGVLCSADDGRAHDPALTLALAGPTVLFVEVAGSPCCPGGGEYFLFAEIELPGSARRDGGSRAGSDGLAPR